MKTRILWLDVVFVTVALLAPVGSLSIAAKVVSAPPQPLADGAVPAPPAVDEAAARAQVERAFGQLPLIFVENQGQINEQVAYYVQGGDKDIYFTPEGVTFALTSRQETVDSRREMIERHLPDYASNIDLTDDYPAMQRWAVKLDFAGANPNVRPVGEEQAETIISYFKGPQENWRTGLPTYARIVYYDLWPGIDLVYYGAVNQLKYEFVVHPGADPAQIRLAYRGATGVALNAAGQMEVTTPLGGFTDDTPVAYQEIDGRRVPVEMDYRLMPAAGTAGERVVFEGATLDLQPATFNFSVGGYDPTRPLILDPAVLIYCGYIGGAGEDWSHGIAVDGTGNAYVTGKTWSDETTFPVVGGPDLTYNGGYGDAFVAKVRSDGTGLVYAGYIGGAGEDYGQGIAVDGTGNAYVTGDTQSDETTFPVVGGPDLTHNGGRDAFVAKVRSDGTGLVYAGYIGGAVGDAGAGIAVDGTGNAYVTGQTLSNETTFPVVGGPDLTHNGGGDAFVAKVRSDGAALVYCGYIGGAGNDYGDDIAVDGVGNAYVTGSTESDETTFPVVGGPDLTHNGGSYDAFVAKVRADGAGLVYAGYIGGAGWDAGLGIAVDGVGNAYVTGYTSSDGTTFPVVGGPDLTHNGGGDAFVAKVRSGGAGLVYAGYIGGADNDGGYGIAVDGVGNAYVMGHTRSDETTFPVVGGPDLTHNGYTDAFVTKVSGDGGSGPTNTLVYIGAMEISGQSVFFLGEIDRRITLGDHVHLQLPFRNVGNAILTNAVVTITGTLPTFGSVGVKIHNGSSWSSYQQPITLTPSILAPGQTGIADFWIYVTNPDPGILQAMPTGTWMRLSDSNNDWTVSILLEPIAFDIAEYRDMLAGSCLHNPGDPQIQRYAQYVAGVPEASSTPSNSNDPDTVEQAIRNLVYQVNTEFHYKDIWNTRQSDTILLSTRNGDIGVCRDYADLTTGLLRALGLPARYTDAVFVKPRPFWSDEIAGHAWVEAYLGVGGWRQVDSTWGRSFDESIYEARGYRVQEVWADRHPLSSATIWAAQQYQCIIPCYTAPVDCPTCLRESNTPHLLWPWQQPDLTCVEDVTSRYHQTRKTSNGFETSEVWSPDERLLVNIQSPTFVTRTMPFTLNTGIVNSTTLSLNAITATVAISAYVDSQAPLFEMTPPYHVFTNVNPGQTLTLTWIVTPLLAGSGLPLRVGAMSEDLFEIAEHPLMVNEPGTLPDLLLTAGCDPKIVQIGTPFTVTASIADEHLRVITDSLSTITAMVYTTPTLAFSTTFSLPYCTDCQHYAYELILPSDAPIGRYQLEYKVVRLGYESGHVTSSFFVVPALTMTLITDPLVLNMTDPMTLTAQVFDRGTAITQAGVYAEITTPGGVTAIPLFSSEGAVYTAILRPADLADSLGAPLLPGQWTIKAIGNYQGGMAAATQLVTIRYNIYLPLILRNY